MGYTEFRTAVLDDSPAGFWEQTETTGPTLADSSGNGRDLTLASFDGQSPNMNQPGPVAGMSAIGWTPGEYANSTATINGPSTSTYAALIKLPAAPGVLTPIVVPAPTGGSSGNTSGLFITAAGHAQGFHYPQSPITDPSPLTFGQWHWVVCSTGAAGSKVRVDKVTTVSSATTSDAVVNGNVLWLHSYRNGAQIIVGGAVEIAAPAFWTSQLSDAQTDAHFDALGPIGSSARLSLPSVLPAVRSSLAVRSFTHTDTSNRRGGRIRGGYAIQADNTDPVELPPAGTATRRDKALWYPDPTLVDGRPT